MCSQCQGVHRDVFHFKPKLIKLGGKWRLLHSVNAPMWWQIRARRLVNLWNSQL